MKCWKLIAGNCEAKRVSPVVRYSFKTSSEPCVSSGGLLRGPARGSAAVIESEETICHPFYKLLDLHSSEREDAVRAPGTIAKQV